MGRSVSYADNYSAIAYVDVSDFGTCENEDGEEFDNDFQAQINWDFWLENVQEQIMGKWGSFVTCNKWLEREVHAILANDFAYITVSSYGGLASLCLVSRYEYDDVCYDESQRMANLSKGFCGRIASRFEKMFGEYRKIGSFSNGEGVFEKVA